MCRVARWSCVLRLATPYHTTNTTTPNTTTPHHPAACTHTRLLRCSFCLHFSHSQQHHSHHAAVCAGRALGGGAGGRRRGVGNSSRCQGAVRGQGAPCRPPGQPGELWPCESMHHHKPWCPELQAHACSGSSSGAPPHHRTHACAHPTCLSPQILLHNGRQLQDGVTLLAAGVSAGATLAVTRRLRGGGGDGGSTGAESRSCYLEMYAEKKPDKVCVCVWQRQCLEPGPAGCVAEHQTGSVGTVLADTTPHPPTHPHTRRSTQQRRRSRAPRAAGCLASASRSRASQTSWGPCSTRRPWWARCCTKPCPPRSATSPA